MSMVNFACSLFDRSHTMPDGLWVPLVIIVVVFVYVLAKVRHYMRRSEEQWQEVDKSKLREWDDDEDWPA